MFSSESGYFMFVVCDQVKPTGQVKNMTQKHPTRVSPQIRGANDITNEAAETDEETGRR